MNYSALFLAATLCLPLSSAFAWGEKRNGGDIIVCQNPASAELLDVYEARVQHNMTPKFMIANTKTPKTIQSILARPVFHSEITFEVLRKINANLIHDSAFAEIMINKVLVFFNHVAFVNIFHFDDIPDEGLVSFPLADCSLQQLIVQNPNATKGYKYYINYQLWHQLDSHNQVAAILHEVVYSAVSELNPGVMDSKSIRYFVALILSDRLSTLTRKEYFQQKFNLYLDSGFCHFQFCAGN